jgi:cytochrome P450
VLLDARQAQPGEDLLSALLVAEADGEQLSRAELRNIVATLLFAGQDTTRRQLGLAVATFLRHPDQWTLLAEDPQLAAQAVDEVVRFAPTTPITSRWRPVTSRSRASKSLRARACRCSWPRANTDPTAVEEPGRFDITAVRPPPLTFGSGLHYCLGAGWPAPSWPRR